MRSVHRVKPRDVIQPFSDPSIAGEARPFVVEKLENWLSVHPFDPASAAFDNRSHP
jgi:hypothetical protein